MVRNKLKNMALSIAVLMGLGMASPVFAKSDYNPGDILALGSDLTDAQEAALRKYFNAPDGTNTIYVTDEVIIKQLGLDPNDPIGDMKNQEANKNSNQNGNYQRKTQKDEDKPLNRF